jgi:hypothetical protein
MIQSVGMGMRVVFSCSVQERILSIADTIVTKGTSLFIYEGSSQQFSTPTSKAVGVVGLWRCMVET